MVPNSDRVPAKEFICTSKASRVSTQICYIEGGSTTHPLRDRGHHPWRLPNMLPSSCRRRRPMSNK